MALLKTSVFINGCRQMHTKKWGFLLTSCISISSSYSSMIVSFTSEAVKAQSICTYKPFKTPPPSYSSFFNQSRNIFKCLSPEMDGFGASFFSTTRTTLSSECSNTRPFCTNNPPTPPPDTSKSSLGQIFKWVSPVDTYLPVILKLGMDGNIQEMETLCAEMVKVMVPFSVDKVFDELIDSLVSNGKFDEALRVVKILMKLKSSCDLSISSLNNVLEYLCEHHRIELALHQFNSMIHKDTKTFEIILVAVCNKKMIEESIMLLDQLFEWLKATNNPAPTCLDFYCQVIQFIYKTNEPGRLSHLLTVMTELDIPHNMVETSDECVIVMSDVYYDTVKAFCYLWRFDEAVKFLEEHSIKDTGPYDALIESYCNAGMVDEANNLLEKMIKKDLNSVHSWTIIIKALCVDEEIDKALETVKRMLVHWDQIRIRENQSPSLPSAYDRIMFQAIGRIPKLEENQSPTCGSFPSVFDRIMSESIGGILKLDGLLTLAIKTMFNSDLWKEDHKRDAGKTDVAELQEVRTLTGSIKKSIV